MVTDCKKVFLDDFGDTHFGNCGTSRMCASQAALLSYLKKPRGLGKLAHVCIQHAPHITAVKKMLTCISAKSVYLEASNPSEYQSPTILELLGSFDISPRLQTCQVCLPRESNAEDRLLVPVRPAVQSQLEGSVFMTICPWIGNTDLSISYLYVLYIYIYINHIYIYIVLERRV